MSLTTTTATRCEEVASITCSLPAVVLLYITSEMGRAKTPAPAPTSTPRAAAARPSGLRPYRCGYCNHKGWDRQSLRDKHVKKSHQGTSEAEDDRQDG